MKVSRVRLTRLLQIPSTHALKLIIYPIKSLRGVDLPSANATKNGFPYDRVFMLLKDEGEAVSGPSKRYVNMLVSRYNQMALFTTAIQYPDGEHQGSIKVTFSPPDGEQKSTSIPLDPEVAELPLFEVDLHKSRTTCYRMDQRYGDWFSRCFGFDVVLVYLGPSLRNVLFTLAPLKAANNQSWPSYLTGGDFRVNSSSPLREDYVRGRGTLSAGLGDLSRCRI
jgi:uncharacterized protein YcbX